MTILGAPESAAPATDHQCQSHLADASFGQRVGPIALDCFCISSSFVLCEWILPCLGVALCAHVAPSGDVLGGGKGGLAVRLFFFGGCFGPDCVFVVVFRVLSAVVVGLVVISYSHRVLYVNMYPPELMQQVLFLFKNKILFLCSNCYLINLCAIRGTHPHWSGHHQTDKIWETTVHNDRGAVGDALVRRTTGLASFSLSISCCQIEHI